MRTNPPAFPSSDFLCQSSELLRYQLGGVDWFGQQWNGNGSGGAHGVFPREFAGGLFRAIETGLAGRG